MRVNWKIEQGGKDDFWVSYEHLGGFLYLRPNGQPGRYAYYYSTRQEAQASIDAFDRQVDTHPTFVPGPYYIDTEMYGSPGRPLLYAQSQPPPYNQPVATVSQRSGHPSVSCAETDATARLLCAAPELFAACRQWQLVEQAALALPARDARLATALRGLMLRMLTASESVQPRKWKLEEEKRGGDTDAAT